MATFLKEGLESLLYIAEIFRREAPHVHRYRCILRQCIIYTINRIENAVFFALDRGTLYYVGQITSSIRFAYTTAYRTMFAQRIAYAITYHAILVLLTCYLVEEFRQYFKRLLTIEIVGIDYCKRLFDQVLTHQYCMVRAPRLGALRIVGIPFRNVVNSLETNLTRHFALVLCQDYTLKIVSKIFANNEYNLTESCTKCIENGIIHNGLPIRAQTINLLETTIAASHTSSEYKKSWFHLSNSIIFVTEGYICLILFYSFFTEEQFFAFFYGHFAFSALMAEP